jgi:hypothetical protein
MKSLRNAWALLAVAVALVHPARAAGQAVDSLPGTPERTLTVQQPDWGTVDRSVLALSAWDFESLPGDEWSITTGGFRYHSGGPLAFASLRSGVFLPTGALLDFIAAEACDNSSVAPLQIQLFICDPGAPEVNCPFFIASSGVSQTPGCGNYFLDLRPENIQINNSAFSYYVGVTSAVLNDTIKFRTVRYYYRLQVSPAPTVATFPNDVPTTHPFFRFVEALARAGITAGCAPNSFCPDQPLTRGQMAVFLAAALGLHFPN